MSMPISSVNMNAIYSQSSMKSQVRNLGIPDDVISQGYSAIQDYASENGISLPDVSSQLPKPKGSGEKMDFPA